MGSASGCASSGGGKDLRQSPPIGAIPIKARLDGSGTPTRASLDLVAPLNTFGLELLAHECAADRSGNVVISPASIGDALAMTLAGARAQTAVQMRRALCLQDLTPSQVDQGWADLVGLFHAKTNARVRVANSLWLRHGVAYTPTFLATNRQYFAATARDLQGDPSAASKAINSWAELQTDGLIKNLIGPTDLNSAVSLVLVNTIYVAAGWKHFPSSATNSGPFVLSSGRSVDVPMMHGVVTANVARTADYVAVPIRANGSITVTLVVPSGQETPESVVSILMKRGLHSLNEHTTYASVDIALPRVHVSFTDEDLDTTLQGLGMMRAFSPAEANFTGIASGPLWISQIVHKAVLDLNEKGVVAAAGTAVVMAGAAPPKVHLEVRADRPFVVLLSDGNSGAPLFMAVVRDPR